MVFLESSAFIKLFFAERGSPEMVSLVERTNDKEKYVSSLAFVETRSAIRRRERAREITREQAAMAILRLTEEERRVVQHPIDLPVLQQCDSILDTHALRTLDAIQLATVSLVKRRSSASQNIYFVCSDQKLLQAARAEGLSTWNPEDEA